MTETTETIVTLVIDGVAAMGSILVAILAIWGKSFRKYFYKPKLSLMIDESSDCCVEIKKERENESNEEQTLQVRGQIINNGNETAWDAMAIVEEVYKQMGDGSFSKCRQFMPSQLIFCSNKKNKQHITPNLSDYIEIAKVKQWQPNMTSTSQSSNKQNYKLYLQIDGPLSTIELGKGKFIVPLKIFYKGAKSPIVSYIWLHWDCDGLSKKELTARIVSTSDFRMSKK